MHVSELSDSVTFKTVHVLMGHGAVGAQQVGAVEAASYGYGTTSRGSLTAGAVCCRVVGVIVKGSRGLGRDVEDVGKVEGEVGQVVGV